MATIRQLLNQKGGKVCSIGPGCDGVRCCLQFNGHCRGVMHMKFAAADAGIRNITHKEYQP